MNEYIEKICRIGQGSKCCRYLGAGDGGLECLRIRPELKKTIDEKWKVESHVAQGKNCEGQPLLAIAKRNRMLINVIHDPARTDRKVLLESEIARHNLTVKWWPAIKDPVMSFRGISLAHKQIVRWAREEDIDNVCIAEDDMHLTDVGAWEYFIDNMPEDFDLYLSGVYCGTEKPDHTITDFCGLHLYIVNRRFYDMYLGVSDTQNLDRGMVNKGKFVVSHPFCAVQHAGWSDNKQCFKNYDYLLEGKKLCCDHK